MDDNHDARHIGSQGVNSKQSLDLPDHDLVSAHGGVCLLDHDLVSAYGGVCLSEA